jgi:eukaryotic-like serine/threonine-protein kinase
MATPPQEVYNERYEPVRLAARGGMAEVWLARDALLDRTVALKVLFTELSIDPNFVERFRREAQAAANLSHPNIVSIYDWGQAGHTYFIVMEYVEGRALSLVLREEGTLLADRAAAIGADVAAALGFAHRNGVIHRDVKPGNVLITTDDHVKVTDFGIAMAIGTDDHLTQTGAVMGTATYFSPEQAQGLPVDQRSDVYSLGVVLYEMVTGRPPFVADGPVAVAYKHVHEQPVRPTDLVAEIPPAFEAIVLQAMAKDLKNRYASAEELRADLNRFRTGRPVLADPRPRGAGAVGLAGRPAGAATAAGPGAPARATNGGGPGAIGALPPAGPAGPPMLAVGPPADGGEVPVGDERTTDDRHSTVWRYIVMLVVLLVALGVVLVLLGRQLGIVNSNSTGAPALAPPPPTAPVSVPSDLIGKSFTDAASEVEKLGLRYLRADVEDAQHPQNTVVNTSPAAGQQVATNGVVTLDVSSGPLPITEPDVVGLDVQTATKQLQQAGFTVGAPQQQVSATVPTGQVISTNPPPGSQGHNGDTVTIVVSAPKTVIAIPDVSNNTQLQAAGVLVKAGFQVVVASRQASPTVPAGNVIGTNPAAGTPDMQGSTVGFIVSLGPSPVYLPYVIGSSESRARSRLEGVGLVVTESMQPVTNSSSNGVILDESPSPGSQVPGGSTVTLTVGQYAPPPNG